VYFRSLVLVFSSALGKKRPGLRPWTINRRRPLVQLVPSGGVPGDSKFQVFCLLFFLALYQCFFVPVSERLSWTPNKSKRPLFKCSLGSFLAFNSTTNAERKVIRRRGKLCKGDFKNMSVPQTCKYPLQLILETGDVLYRKKPSHRLSNTKERNLQWNYRYTNLQWNSPSVRFWSPTQLLLMSEKKWSIQEREIVYSWSGAEEKWGLLRDVFHDVWQT